MGTYNSPDLSVNINISTINELIIAAANLILIFYFVWNSLMIYFFDYFLSKTIKNYINSK